MSTDRPDGREGFLSRWSRVKTEARDAEPAAEPAQALPAKASDDAPPELPPIEKLTLDSDFSGFFHPKVDDDVRRAALKKLFSDPHFNVMDGLDTYIDDYSKTEPIPAEMLAGLKQAQRIFAWAAEKKDDAPAENSAAPELTAPEAVEQPLTLPQPGVEAAPLPQDDLQPVPRKA